MLLVRDLLADARLLRSESAPRSPAVSIVVVAEAGADVQPLRITLDSILRQSEGDFELLLIDDGVNSSVARLLEEYQNHDARVIVVRHDRSSGIPALRFNEGIEMARGEWVACLHAGDVWSANALALLLDTARGVAGRPIILGRARITGEGSSAEFPDAGLSSWNVCVANRIVTGSVLLPRQVFDRRGLFNCSIPMRQLYEWDFWLRLVHVERFHGLANVLIEAATFPPGSDGRVSPDDVTRFRALHSLRIRDHLTPARWRDFVVDELSVAGTPLPELLAKQLYARDILPYYLAHRHHFPQIEGFPAQRGDDRVRWVGLVRPQIDCLDHISFLNFDAAPSAGRRSFHLFHARPDDLRSRGETTPAADGWLLNRLTEPEDQSLVRDLLAAGPPVGYYLDDDLLKIHLDGADFDQLRPGQPQFETLRQIVSDVDAVWVTNDFIGGSVREHNPRTVPHLGCVLPDYLPERPPRRDPSRPTRIGYVGSGCRLDEFRFLWEAFQRIADEFSGQIEIEFWGPDMAGLPSLSCPWKHVPFTHNYFEYLDRLRRNRFDILICPLFASTPARLGKGLIKYLEFAIAGAVGIFSDVPPYALLPDGETCLKSRNTVDDWQRVLREAITMPAVQFDRLRAACIAHVREEYNSPAVVPLYEASWRATEFHARTRNQRGMDGKPRIAFVHSSPQDDSENASGSLKECAEIVRRYGIEPVLLHADSELEPRLSDLRPAMVHALGADPQVAKVCRDLNLPLVVAVAGGDSSRDDSLSGTSYDDGVDLAQVGSLHAARCLAEKSSTETFCTRGAASREAFDLGRRRLLNLAEAPSAIGRDGPLRIVMVGPLRPEGRQLEAIAAAGSLRRSGLDVRLRVVGDETVGASVEYSAACQRQIERDGSRARVALIKTSPGWSELFADADLLLHLDPPCGFPAAIRNAMAAGVLVAVPPHPDLAELLLDGITALTCGGGGVAEIVASLRRAAALADTERVAMLNQARRVALAEFHPHRIANDVFQIYLRTMIVHRERSAGLATGRQTDVPAAPHWLVKFSVERTDDVKPLETELKAA
ncbi:MAG: glycosyltransferase [Planctomycetales bacterium]|nr:glycosyltransferase [Planctomycetales bacterium]